MAAVVGERAAIGEDAAGEVHSERWEEPRNRVQPAVVLANPSARNASQQPDGVRMAWVLQDRLDRPLLDESSGVQHADAVAHLRDDAQVVADEEDGGVHFSLDQRNEIEHLRLDRRVEARRRLVEDEERRILGQRHRDHDPLLHAARELVRVAAHHARRVCDLHANECGLTPLARLLRGHAENGERLGDLRPDLQGRVQGRSRVLVDHRDRPRVVLAECAAAESEHVLACYRDRAAGDAAVPWEVPHDPERRRRLPAAGLAHEPVRAPAPDRERDAPENGAVDPADAVDEIEVGDLERRSRGVCAHRS